DAGRLFEEEARADGHGADGDLLLAGAAEGGEEHRVPVGDRRRRDGGHRPDGGGGEGGGGEEEKEGDRNCSLHGEILDRMSVDGGRFAARQLSTAMWEL